MFLGIIIIFQVHIKILLGNFLEFSIEDDRKKD